MKALVDYNNLSPDGEVWVPHSYVEDGPALLGDDVVTYDPEDNTCKGVVTEVQERGVVIWCDLETWRDG